MAGGGTRVNRTVGRPVPTVQKNRSVNRSNRPVRRGLKILGTVWRWEPDRFVYRAGPVPPGTNRTGPVPTGFANPGQHAAACSGRCLVAACSGGRRGGGVQLRMVGGGRRGGGVLLRMVGGGLHRARRATYSCRRRMAGGLQLRTAGPVGGLLGRWWRWS
jgi:hypothetical protein